MRDAVLPDSRATATLETSERNPYVINSALRTLDVLKVFTTRPHRFNLTELATHTGLEKNQLYRSVKTLEMAGYLMVAADGRFELTSLLHSLSAATAWPRQQSLPDLASGVLDDLAKRSQESVNLFVRTGDYAICVDRRESSHMVRLASPLGHTVPLHAGAVPKAMLAHIEEEDRQRIIAGLTQLPAYTTRTVLDAASLRRELEDTRIRGYSISDEDYDASARGVGAPIFDDRGRVVAGVSVGGPSFRVDEKTLDALGQLVTRGAQEISDLLRRAG